MKDTKAPAAPSSGHQQSANAIPNDTTKSKETADVRQVAVRVVEDVLTRATEQTDPGRTRSGADTSKGVNGGPVQAKSKASLDPDEDSDFSSAAPTIQIDLVGSRTPSPEEPESTIQFPTYASSRTERRNKADAANAASTPTTPDPASDPLIGDQAKRLSSASKLEPLEIESSPGGAGSTSKNRRAPWHTRFRAAFSSFMQAVCVCGERREDALS